MHVWEARRRERARDWHTYLNWGLILRVCTNKRRLIRNYFVYRMNEDHSCVLPETVWFVWNEHPMKALCMRIHNHSVFRKRASVVHLQSWYYCRFFHIECQSVLSGCWLRFILKISVTLLCNINVRERPIVKCSNCVFSIEFFVCVSLFLSTLDPTDLLNFNVFY